jgi:glycosyltransferase involved in cell wall biosynthesis
MTFAKATPVKQEGPVRLLFLNTRDQCGADVAVHLSLMAHFRPDEARVFVISNSEAADADEMRDRFASMPHVTAVFMPLGRPSQALAGRGKVGKAMAYAPSLASLARAAAYVRGNRIQIVHATDRPRDASYVSLLGYMSRAISVVHMHAPVTDLSRPTVWGMRHSAAIFSVSEAVRVDLIRSGLDSAKIHTVYNAVDPEHFDPDRQRDASPSIRDQYGIPRAAPLAGIAARMNPWKGQLELIGAVSQLRATHPDIHVMILGADVPEMRARYEQHAREGGVADRVHFGGFQRDVRPFLHEFDMFVHPSYGEPFGLSIVEAMAMRKPVIACNTGGPPEIITHGEDGLLVEERSAGAVASAMSTLLDNPQLGKRMGERARETVRSRFTPRHQCATAARKYAELVAAR